MNLLVAQCGGPTAVINASLAAFVEHGQATPTIHRIWGARLGLEGLVQGDWVELTDLARADLDRLATQPGAALGAGRHRLPPGGYEQLLALCAARSISGLALIGGNGSMAAAHAIAHAALQRHVPLQVIGIPKTIDNDLAGTEVAPGYGSAATFLATATQSLMLDLYSMRHFDDVVVLEVMGRHAGWLAAAAALASSRIDDVPVLILLPEVPIDEAHFLAQVEALHSRNEACLVVAAEGVKNSAGHYLADQNGATARDASGQRLLSLAAGVAPYLAKRIDQEFGLRCRQIRPDLIQRSCRHPVNETDRMLARLVGAEAAAALSRGDGNSMIALFHDGQWHTRLVELANVVGKTRTMPAEYYDPARYAVRTEGVARLYHLTGLGLEDEDVIVW